jgi:hypothetical protein
MYIYILYKVMHHGYHHYLHDDKKNYIYIYIYIYLNLYEYACVHE